MTSPQDRPGSLATRKKLWLIPKVLVSLGLLAFALSMTDRSAGIEVLSTIPAWAWLAGIVLIALQLPVLALRWVIILRASGAELGYGDACRFTYTGFFFNQSLPSSVGGDFMRAFLAWKTGLVFKTAMASVLLERATGLFVLALFSAFLLTGEPADLGAGWTHASLAGLMILLAFIGLAILFLLNKWLGGSRSDGALWSFLAEIAMQFRNLVRRRNAFTSVFLLGGLSSLMGLSAIAVAAFSQGLPLTYFQVLGVSALAIVATVIPVSISGWGVRETFFIWLLTPLGISAEQAFGLSVWFGLASIIASIPGGISWLRSR